MTRGTQIQVVDNDFKEVSGGSGLGTAPIQYNTVTGAGNQINYNTVFKRYEGLVQGVNGAGQTTYKPVNPRDVINLYKSSGTPGSPIEVIGNYIYSRWDLTPEQIATIGNTTAFSGASIQLSDSSETTSQGNYQIAKDNTIIVESTTGGIGWGIRLGHDGQIINNIIYGPPKAGRNWSEGMMARSTLPTGCYNITIKANRVSWIKANGKHMDARVDPSCGNVTLADNSWSGLEIQYTRGYTPVTTPDQSWKTLSLNSKLSCTTPRPVWNGSSYINGTDIFQPIAGYTCTSSSLPPPPPNGTPPPPPPPLLRGH